MHQSNHTPEQRGVDVYLKGSIYTDYNETGNTSIGPNFTYNDKYMVIGPHSFKDGEDVTGRYEFGYEVKFDNGWQRAERDAYERYTINNMPSRIVAVPLPSKGQEGEAERKQQRIAQLEKIIEVKEKERQEWADMCIRKQRRIEELEKINLQWESQQGQI